MINIRIILFLFIASALCFIWLRIQGGPLQQSYAPQGIVSLELANTKEKAIRITSSWEQGGMVPVATKNILIDFIFIPFYSLLLYTLTGSIAVRLHGMVAQVGMLLSLFSMIAGMLDGMENILMLLSLGGWVYDLSTLITTILAGTKFFLLLLAFPYTIVAGSYVIATRKKRAHR